MDLDNRIKSWLPYYYIWYLEQRIYIFPPNEKTPVYDFFNEVCNNFFKTLTIESSIPNIKNANIRKNGKNILKIDTHPKEKFFFIIWGLYNKNEAMQKLLQYSCLNSLQKYNFSTLKVIGAGTNGIVYKVDNKVVIKIEFSKSSKSIKKIEQHVKKYDVTAGDLRIGPKIYDFQVCKKQGTLYTQITMENLGIMTFSKYWNKYLHEQNKYDRQIIEFLKEIKTQYLNLGFNQGDLKGDNVMIVGKKIKIIDYGSAKDFHQGNIDFQFQKFIKSLTTSFAELSNEKNIFCTLELKKRNEIIKMLNLYLNK